MAEDLFGIVGTVIASAYHVESVVAEGGFGIVYRARHAGFRAPVALKCLKVPQQLGSEHQRRFVEHFRAEGEVMFRLSASIPSVVRPLHVDVMHTPAGAFVPYLVLEWLEGETLDAILRARVQAGKRGPSVPESLALLEPVALALERAHHFDGPAGRESIAHCDIKPENVFVARAGGERLVKILDFGVAKVRAATHATPSAPGGQREVALFTPAYGAPEQWNPKSFGEAGPWTDVYGLGLTLAETLVGRPVIAGDHVTMMKKALDRAQRPTPRAHGVVVGDALEAVVLRALAVDPRERYPDAGAFWRAVKDAGSRPLEVATAPAPDIPDLVPIQRKPSGAHKLDLELPPKATSGTHTLNLPTMGNVDFEDDASGEGSGLDVDLPSSVPPPVSQRQPAAPVLSAAPQPAPLIAPAPVMSSAPAPALPQVASLRAPVKVAIERPLARRLAPAIGLCGGSIVLTLLDRAYAAANSEVFSLGPIRTSWLAGALLLAGLAWAVRELIPKS